MNSRFFLLCIILGKCLYKSYIDKPFLNSFNSKTAYRNSDLLELDNPNKGLESCKLIHINTIFRHGSRFPSKKYMIHAENLFDKINNSQFRDNLPKDFLNWKLSFPIDQEKQLSTAGIEEMRGLGQRFGVRYRSLIDSNLDLEKNLRIYSTSLSRSHNSAGEFLNSFAHQFGLVVNVNETIKENDKRLRYFSNCDFYSKFVKKNKNISAEYKKFIRGPELRRVIEDIKEKYQLPDGFLTEEDITVLYTMCGFEIASNLSVKQFPWQCSIGTDGQLTCMVKDKSNYHNGSVLCSLFKRNHYPVLEYIYDLKHFWRKSYGHPIIREMSCELVSVMIHGIMHSIKAQESSEDYVKSVFWFSHAEAILPVIALLDLFHPDIPMTSDTLQERLDKMKDPKERFTLFRTANIVPFSSNLGFEIYQCPEQPETEKYRVQIRLNEKIVPWPHSNQSNYISLSEFQRRLKMCTHRYFNFEQLCKT